MSTTNGQVSTPAPSPSRMTTWHQDFFTAVEKWPWLATLNDSVSGVVQPVYDRFRGNLAVELLHGGRWAGHALHPALSDLPIGFWSSSLLLDVVSQDGAPDSRRWGPAATLSAAGLASAVATATTGVADWTVSDGEDRRVGLFHGLLNGAAMVLQGASLAARLAGRRTPALGLSAAGMAAVAAAGFVGGHLVQGRGAMVNRVAANTGPTRWVKAVAEDDLTDGESKGVDVEGRKVLLYRDHGTVYAIDDVCTHAGALLSRGPVVDCVVTCPLHESQFDVRDGRIVRGPAHHPQPALPARVRNGWVEVRGSQPVKRRAKT